MKKNILFIFIFNSIMINSCSKFNPFDDKVNTSSDGAYVIETGMTDQELLSYGQRVVYRFKSVPNMIAVKEINMGKQTHRFTYQTNIYNLFYENQKIRTDFINNKIKTDMSRCSKAAYCEANFDKAYNYIRDNKIILSPIKVAIVDSGIIPATDLIKNKLISSYNLTENLDMNNWSSHATYIASVFSGIIKKKSKQNIYAENANLNSIKISFADDVGDSEVKNYGSMQLAAALDVAVSSGAKVVNLSLSYNEEPDQNVEMAEKIVISNAAKSGVFFVVAAGNEGKDLGLFPAYPASYNLNNMISVASHSSNLSLATTSNFGNLVELSALGSQVELNNRFSDVDTVSGTSFAAPIVSSAISIYLGLFPNTPMSTVLNNLFSSANSYYDPIYSDSFSVSTKYGRLDVESFIKYGYLTY